jgi:hypothetical protein
MPDYGLPQAGIARVSIPLQQGSSWLGGLINYNPPPGQTAAERLGLFGAALRDASAYFQGRPQLAGSLDNSIAEHRRRLQLLQETALAAQRSRAAASALPGPDPLQPAVIRPQTPLAPQLKGMWTA